MSNFYVHESVSKKAVNRFFADFFERNNELYSVEIVRDGELKLKAAPEPYDCSQAGEMYSLSKSFVSIAIGILCDEGRLSLEDKMVDLFPDKLPEIVSDNLSEMRIKHLLSMTTGHSKGTMPAMYPSNDVIREFLNQEVTYKPGTKWMYNTGATCAMSAVVEKLSGMKLFDFVDMKIFRPLHIENVSWNICGEGVNEGGIGLHLSCDDILKFTEMLYNRGTFEGKRIVSAEYIDAASSLQSDNSFNGVGTGEWASGYGYQFWMCSRTGFRADGSFGQFGIVIHDYNTIVAIREYGDMQSEVDAIYDFVEHMYDKDDDEQALEPFYAPLDKTDIKPEFINKLYKLDNNVLGFTTFCLQEEENGLVMKFSDGRSFQRIKAGNGEYINSSYFAKWRKPKLEGLMDASSPEVIDVASSYTMEGNVFTVFSRHLNSPHVEYFRVTVDGEMLDISIENKYIPDKAKKLTGREIR